jgi:hypothetical protein
MSTFLVVVIVVGVVGFVLGLGLRFFRSTSAMEQIGRRGGGALSGGQSDADARERPGRPYADEPEESPPARPLRGRPE